MRKTRGGMGRLSHFLPSPPPPPFPDRARLFFALLVLFTSPLYSFWEPGTGYAFNNNNNNGIYIALIHRCSKRVLRLRSNGTTLNVRKLKCLVVQSSPWAERKYWTVPCERSVWSNFAACRKFIRSSVKPCSVRQNKVIRDGPLENLWGGGGAGGRAKYKKKIRAREN